MVCRSARGRVGRRANHDLVELTDLLVHVPPAPPPVRQNPDPRHSFSLSTASRYRCRLGPADATEPRLSFSRNSIGQARAMGRLIVRLVRFPLPSLSNQTLDNDIKGLAWAPGRYIARNHPGPGVPSDPLATSSGIWDTIGRWFISRWFVGRWFVGLRVRLTLIFAHSVERC